MPDKNIEFYGFTAVPRDPDVLFRDHPTASGDSPEQDPTLSVADFAPPETKIALEVKKYAKEELDELTFNHSNRVYVYGLALVKTHFPSWSFDPETYYFACLLHDIGTCDKFYSSKLSFEFKGAIVARDLLLALGAVEDQADSVCDAIVRHQDIFVNGGNITMLGQVLQLATILDNVGTRSQLLHPNLIKSTTTAFPRRSWSDRFGQVIERELNSKPWCHTSTFEEAGWKPGSTSNFASAVRGNTAMVPYEDRGVGASTTGATN